ncbi:hypothetical protein PG985_002694 [Apiospora marii]|uniref:uncharacterized protein n=1 Tax=Apiospora marii TaxID=335849 RepID=UPI00312E31E6
MDKRHLDPDTGLVYYERQFQHRTPHDKWHMRPINPARRPPSGSKGARSLMDMTMTVIGDNLNLISAQDLKCCPELLRWRILDHCYDEGRLLNFHGWKTFLDTLAGHEHPRKKDKPFGFDGVFRFYRVSIGDSRTPLSVFLDPLRSNPLKSPEVTFLVRLTISHGASFGKNEMLALAGLENLCTLSIMSPELDPDLCGFPRVDDRLAREWSLLRRPFPSLRTLRIWGNGFTTFRSLEHVLAFPLLQVYNVAGRYTDWNSRKLDGRYRCLWTRDKPEDPDQPIEAEFKKIRDPYAVMHLGVVDGVGFREATPTSRYETCYTYVYNGRRPKPNGASKVFKRPISSVSEPVPAPKGKRLLNIDQVFSQFSNS